MKSGTNIKSGGYGTLEVRESYIVDLGVYGGTRTKGMKLVRPIDAVAHEVFFLCQQFRLQFTTSNRSLILPFPTTV